MRILFSSWLNVSFFQTRLNAFVRRAELGVSPPHTARVHAVCMRQQLCRNYTSHILYVYLCWSELAHLYSRTAVAAAARERIPVRQGSGKSWRYINACVCFFLPSAGAVLLWSIRHGKMCVHYVCVCKYTHTRAHPILLCVRHVLVAENFHWFCQQWSILVWYKYYTHKCSSSKISSKLLSMPSQMWNLENIPLNTSSCWKFKSAVFILVWITFLCKYKIIAKQLRA